MCDSWNVLVVSGRVEKRWALMRILESLPVNSIGLATLVQAQEVLAAQEIDIVFCDDVLRDGTYRDLFWMQSIVEPCVVVLARMAEPGDAGEVIKQGAFDVLPYLPESADVERVVVRAARYLRRQNEQQHVMQSARP